MRMYDIIVNKRDGKALSQEEIRFWIDGYTKGEIPDYQTAALLMAICLQGMTSQETAWLTMAMAASGETADLSSIPGVKVDKHSTGGVGDKTTLVVGPIAAACGVPVAKMSGRGLGHTGGTVDKLEAIPGFRTVLEPQEFLEIVKREGIALIGQTGNLAPADKKIYALRDVTGTVESIPLIAASIMSKKLAAGADAIVLDVKTGSGAFMKTMEDAIALAREMVAIGVHSGRETVALITDMDLPLGNAIGNSLEVREAIETLQGKGPQDFTQLCLVLAANMLFVAQRGTMEQCMEQASQALYSGTALTKFKAMVQAQGGRPEPELLALSPCKKTVCAQRQGYITKMETRQCGIASVVLGAGRAKKEDPVDYGAGILLHVKPGDRVEAGQPLATLYAAGEHLLKQGAQLLEEAIEIGGQPQPPMPLIYARITKDGVERLG